VVSVDVIRKLQSADWEEKVSVKAQNKEQTVKVAEEEKMLK